MGVKYVAMEGSQTSVLSTQRHEVPCIPEMYIMLPQYILFKKTTS